MSDAVLRTFVAVPLPAPVRAALGDLSARIRTGGLRGRWVPPENLHLTLAFLGDTETRAVAPIRAALTRAAAGCQAFDLTPAGLGVFPGPRRPRVLWVGLQGGLEALGALAEAVGSALAAIGFPLPRRGAVGHLTLARAKEVFDPEALAAVFQRHGGFAGPPFHVHRIVLYRSQLGAGPARYSPLAEAALGAAGAPFTTGGEP
ncbi:MAG: RNA 2',3'-cyclic phosphodiesterase [Deltaproteobacteria bacterium]|nr:RNA 2',3'-cyclic phosphodiesterase [Deltaproteobacteria bacterium]